MVGPEGASWEGLLRRGVIRRHGRELLRLQRLVDLTLISALFYLTTRTFTFLAWHFHEVAPLALSGALPFLLFLTLYFGTARVAGLTDAPRRTWPLTTELWDLARRILVASTGMILLDLIFFKQSLSAPRLWVFAGLALVALLAVRTAMRLALRVLRRYGFNYRTMLIVGDGDRTATLVTRLRGHRGYGMKLLGIITDDPDRLRERISLRQGDVLGRSDQIGDVLRERRVDDIYVTDRSEDHPERIRGIIRDCIDHGISIRITADAPPRIRGLRATGTRFTDLTFYSYAMVPQRSPRMAVKRLLDVLAAGTLLLLFSPVMIATAVAIALTSRGPIFYRQKRMTCGFHEFTLYKFRSMVVDADRIKDALREHGNESDGPVFKIQNDPRVTSLGRIIRRLSIDEFPQLFNVLLGHMSMVGPRPLAVEELDEDFWWRKVRLSVKPGLTGLWQVNGRSTRFEDWVRYDLQYVENWSLRQDVVILLKTIPAVLLGRGAA
jgi:exopolysaccharide biosynthesis polyprenyl glycosylphosphotransferase